MTQTYIIVAASIGGAMSHFVAQLDPTGVSKVLDHAAEQSDRWLFLACIVVIALGGMAIIRYFIRQLAEQRVEHKKTQDALINTLQTQTEKVITVATESKAVIEGSTEALRGNSVVLADVIQILRDVKGRG